MALYDSIPLFSLGWLSFAAPWLHRTSHRSGGGPEEPFQNCLFRWPWGSRSLMVWQWGWKKGRGLFAEKDLAGEERKKIRQIWFTYCFVDRCMMHIHTHAFVTINADLPVGKGCCSLAQHLVEVSSSRWTEPQDCRKKRPPMIRCTVFNKNNLANKQRKMSEYE